MQGPISHQTWKCVVAATLWTLWLARNELIFSRSNQSQDVLRALIMLRVKQWGKASGILCFGNDPLWMANPKGALRVYYNRLSTDYWKYRESSFDLVCAVDGAWGSFCSGAVGGYIKNKSGDLVYVFSGPIKVSNALSAEIEAILHVVRMILSRQLKPGKILICSDSCEALESVREGLPSYLPMKDWIQGQKEMVNSTFFLH